MGLNIEASFSILNLFIVFLVGMLVMIIFSIPTVNSIDQVKASNLFRNVFQSLQFNYSVKSVIISIVLLLVLISLFAIRSSIPFYSVAYFVSFFICLLIFYCLSVTIIHLLKNIKILRFQ